MENATNQRITTAIKESIVADLVKHRFEDELKALVDDFAEFAEEIYNTLYSAEQRKKIASLPSGWLPQSYRIGVQFGTGYNYTQLDFNGSVSGELAKIYRPKETVQKPVSYQHHNGCAIRFEPTSEPSLKYDALKDRLADISNKVSEAKRAANGALSSVTTIKRLCEVWPEVEPFCKKFMGLRPQLPALPTERLNTILDLPVSEAA